MGFGSYDESEQERQQLDSADDDGEGVQTEHNAHEGQVEYEIDASNDELLEKLQDIKEN
ncbi:DUF5786 family protein [Halarchaeum sp. P4]|uniref:DUF5786 family protein n=1 Tax=Halarchaeum sp. P4 TaxID=3421639 RepID=UPI003EB895AB